jgi:hypothetical protein
LFQNKRSKISEDEMKSSPKYPQSICSAGKPRALNAVLPSDPIPSAAKNERVINGAAG